MALNPFLEHQAFNIMHQVNLPLLLSLVSYNPHSDTMLKRSWGETLFAEAKGVAQQ